MVVVGRPLVAWSARWVIVYVLTVRAGAVCALGHLQVRRMQPKTPRLSHFMTPKDGPMKARPGEERSD